MSTVRISTIGAMAALALPALQARSQTLTTLYSFAGGADGANPGAALLYENGVLFGTTEVGGTSGQGTVFKVDAATGAETVLHNFTFGGDGQNPSGALILFRGALFGTTSGGGGGSTCYNAGCGTVFRVDPSTGAEKIVYRFAGGSDGGFPFAGVMAHRGALYGTTGYFGAGYGTVFKLNPGAGTEAVLHVFSQSDGHQPYAPLVMRGGALFGTTEAGGNAGCAQEGCGTIFKLDPASGEESALHLFASTPDGASPLAGLTAHGGAFFGTTTWGGAADFGAAFKIDIKTGTEKVLYSFSGRKDGGNPTAGVLDYGGPLYGTTSIGGTFNKNCIDADQSVGCGTIFRIDPKTGTESVLYRFSGPDGATPTAAPIYQNGAFYGTTSAGGTTGNGTVFKLLP